MLFHIYWVRTDGESGGVVEIGVTANGSGHGDNVVGIWDDVLEAYEFEFDTTDPEWDPDETYSIWDNAVEVADKIMPADIPTKAALDTHTALTAAHGTTGVVVGISDTQTLTNKTIDDDDNVLSNIDAAGLKAGTTAPQIKQKPNAASDTVLTPTADAAKLILQCATAALGADRDLVLKAGAIDLQTRTGGALYLTGLKTPVDADGAATKAQIDALDTRLDVLEVGGSFGGTPEVLLRSRVTRNLGGGFAINAFWRMANLANEGKVARWEVFWNTTGIGTSAGSISDDELMWLRGHCNRLLFRGGEGNIAQLPTNQRVLHVIVVAIDADDLRIASEVLVVELEVEPGVGGSNYFALDTDGNLAPTAVKAGTGEVVIATAADANEAAGAITFTQGAATAPKIKWRMPLTIGSDIRFLQLNVFARATVADKTGLVIARLVAGDGTTAAESTLLIEHETSMPITPTMITVDVGAVAAGAYELQVLLATNEAGQQVDLTSAISLDCVRKVSTY